VLAGALVVIKKNYIINNNIHIKVAVFLDHQNNKSNCSAMFLLIFDGNYFVYFFCNLIQIIMNF
jgi:hypothetical protein